MRVVLLVGIMALASLGAFAQPSSAGYLLEVVSLSDTIAQRVISDPMMYYERWDTLAQPRFWRRVMQLPPDSAVLNIADTRQILEVFSAADYEAMSTDQKRAFKQQKIEEYGLSHDVRLYVTYGKSDYYQIRAVMPHIHESIEVFNAQGVDPWYAQAILLIESPGQLRQSHTGAYGPFQLMPAAAREQGLIVNSRRDDRADVKKAGRAAAGYINRVCIPETERMLNREGIAYSRDDLWFRLLVLHSYHAGPGNVSGALRSLNPSSGGMELIQGLWQVRYRGFGNASQNYSQVALASLLELDRLISLECEILCITDPREESVPVFEVAR